MNSPHKLDFNAANDTGELPFLGTSLAELTKIPKIDLHRHLVGSIRPEVLVYIADKLDVTLATFGNDAERIRSAAVISKPLADGYSQFLRRRIWGAFKDIFSYEKGVANAVYWAIADAARDGVVYIEFRISPYGREFNFKSKLSTATFLEALGRGISKARADFPETLTKIILSVGREAVVKWWGDTVERGKKYDRLISCANSFKEFVVGFDITGDEVAYQNPRFVDFAEKVKSAGFSLTVHAGETGDPNSVLEAIDLLHADRIGHGLGAAKDFAIMEKLAKRRIPLEICPTSNLMLGVVPSLAEHPFREFFRKGMILTINTDDPVLLGPTSQSLEFYRMIAAEQIAFEDVRRITATAIHSSFATDQEKKQIESTVEKYSGNSLSLSVVV